MPQRPVGDKHSIRLTEEDEQTARDLAEEAGEFWGGRPCLNKGVRIALGEAREARQAGEGDRSQTSTEPRPSYSGHAS